MPKATSKGGEDFAPIPAETTLAICYGVIDLGTQPSRGNFPSRRKVLLMFELPNVRADFEVNGVTKNLPRAISQDYTLSTSKKSNLRHELATWRGRDFTEEEAKEFEVGKVVGAMALLSIVHKPASDGSRVYANIGAIMKPLAGTEKRKTENPHVIFDIPERGVIVIPPSIPEWIADRIKQSEEWKDRVNNPDGTVKPAATDSGQAFDTTGEPDNVPF